jgi:hypothetical protein
MRIKGTYILIGVMAIIIALMLYCSPSSPTINVDGGEFIEHKTIVDTIHVEGVPDTVPFYDTIPRYVEILIYKPYYDTIRNLNIYNNPYSDSLIEGVIKSEVDGTLVWQSITYTPKFPKYITKTDTLKINKTDSVIITNPKKVKLYAGFEFGGNLNSFSASPVISMVDKRMNKFSYRYDLVNRTHNIGYARQIKF